MRTTRIYIMLVILFVALSGCNNTPKQEYDASRENKERLDENSISSIDLPTLKKYTSEEYKFTLSYPPSWVAETKEIGNNKEVVTVFPSGAADSTSLPLLIHDGAGFSYVSIFPEGFGTELPSGKSRKISRYDEKPVAFNLNTQESARFLLENDQVWGYFIVPSSPPENWSRHGFIFARVAVSDLVVRCFKKGSGREINPSECNPLLGDTLKRYGEINEEASQRIQKILKSMNFSNETSQLKEPSAAMAKEIAITAPQPGSLITSPLNIKGKARGNWFFEAQLSIELIQNGTSLASTQGKAQGNWMTSNYVPFSATLKFPDIDETGKAELLFRSSNPSGKKETEKIFRLPVEIAR